MKSSSSVESPSRSRSRSRSRNRISPRSPRSPLSSTRGGGAIPKKMSNRLPPGVTLAPPPSDTPNYALLLLLYSLQGIPMGLSLAVPFLLQRALSSPVDGVGEGWSTGEVYGAQAVFALSQFPFSLKLLWAPIVDGLNLKFGIRSTSSYTRPPTSSLPGFLNRGVLKLNKIGNKNSKAPGVGVALREEVRLGSQMWGRRKAWLVPVQLLASCLMIVGAPFVNEQLAIALKSPSPSSVNSATNPGKFNKAFSAVPLTKFFTLLYLLMATQDIVVDGWSLTMLKKENRGNAPVANSVGQNIGVFVSYVGFLSLEEIFGISLGSFVRVLGFVMLAATIAVALFKREIDGQIFRLEEGANISTDLGKSEIADVGVLRNRKRKQIQGDTSGRGSNRSGGKHSDDDALVSAVLNPLSKQPPSIRSTYSLLFKIITSRPQVQILIGEIWQGIQNWCSRPPLMSIHSLQTDEQQTN